MTALLLVVTALAGAPADAGAAKASAATLRPLAPLKTTSPKPPRELITIEGMPSLMAFIDRDQVGVRQGQRFWAWALAAPLRGDVKEAFSVPGRPDQIIVCMNRDCSRGEPCAKERAAARSRACVWLAPKCDQAVLLSERYARVERQNETLLAEVDSTPACLPSDGPEPQWSVRAGSAPADGVLRGELETHACAPPTWKNAVGAFVWTAEKSDVVKADVPACGR
jgi:hypothetical protein